MEVPSLCAECKRPRIIAGCPMCGAMVCRECLAGRHSCARLGSSLLRGALGDQDAVPDAPGVKK